MFIEKPNLQGTVTFGEKNVVSTQVEFVNISSSGSISIGSNNLFEDGVKIINPTGTMKIGSNNIFHSRCIISNSDIGDSNEFGVDAA